MELDGTPAWKIADAVRGGDVSAVAVLEHFVDRIEARDGALNAVYFRAFDDARAVAADVDRRVAAGDDPGPWAGVPIAVKELEDVAGWPSERGSLLFAGKIADTDSPQVRRLREAGAVLVGKTTAPELGSVAFTRTKLHGTTRNPWDPTRTPGGSSGGAAASVAAGMLPIATASDGGGSTRLPAHFSGLVGLKPTYGRIPQGPGAPGIVDCGVTGCLSTNVRDWARWLDVTAGPDPLDNHSLPRPATSWEDRLGTVDVGGLRVGFSADLGYAAVEPAVAAVVADAADRLVAAAGLERVEVDARVRRAGPAWRVLNSVDVLDDMREAWPDRLSELTPAVRTAVEWGMNASLSQASRASEARHAVLRSVVAIFEQVDVLLTPTAPLPAFAAEGPMPTTIADRAVPPDATAAFTIPFNLTGDPAISVPAGFVDGLPVGLQIVAPRLREDRVLELAAIWEQTAPWPLLAPAPGAG